MANKSKSQLKSDNSSVYVNNNAELITPDQIKSFNVDVIDSLALQTDLDNLSGSFIAVSQSYAILSGSSFDSSSFVKNSQTASMTVMSASYTAYALTASYALNGGTGGGNIDSSSLVTTASFGAYTASVSNRATTGSNTFNDDNIFTRNIQVLGTASINYLLTNVVSESVMFSSGSNRLGDDPTDVQQLTGSVGVYGTFAVSGVSTLSGSFTGQFNGSASYVPSASVADFAKNSTTASYIDLSQSPLNWQAQTGVIKGGQITKSSNNKFNLYSGSAQFVSYSYEGVNQVKTSTNKISWSTQTNLSLTYLTDAPATFLYLDTAGTLQQQTSSFTADDFTTKIILGSITHADRTYIDSVETDHVTAFNSGLKADQFIATQGVVKVDGLELLPISGTLGFSVNSGSVFHNGVDYNNDPFNSYIKNIPASVSASISRIYQSGSTYVIDKNVTGLGPQYYKTFDVSRYVSQSQLVDLSGSFAVQRIFQHPDNPTELFVYYGNKLYTSIDSAANGIIFENFKESDATKFNTTFLGYLIAGSTTADLAQQNQAVFIYAGQQRSLYSAGGMSVEVAQDVPTGYTLQFTTASAQWQVQHGLGTLNPLVAVWRSGSNDMVTPQDITSIDENNILIDFSIPIKGAVTVARSGAPFTASYVDYTRLPTASFNTWTGSSNSQFSGTSSYAVTASYALNVAALTSLSSSWASASLTASYLIGGTTSASWASSSLSSSLAVTASSAIQARSASFATLAANAVTASSANTASIAIQALNSFSASVASTATSASYALNSSNAVKSINAEFATASLSASYALSASFVITSSYVSGSNVGGTVSSAFTASYVVSTISASYVSGSGVSGTVSSSFTASYSDTAVSASFARTASFSNTSATASYLTGGNVAANGLTANTLIAGTSSISDVTIQRAFISSSTFGKTGLSTTQSFNGLAVVKDLMHVSGTLYVTGVADFSKATFSGSLVGDLNGTASYGFAALTASNADTASYLLASSIVGTVARAANSDFADVAYTASFITASGVRGIVATAYTASYVTGSNVKGFVANATNANTAISSSIASTASYIDSVNVVGYVSLSLFSNNSGNSTSASYAVTSSHATFASGAVVNYPDNFTSVPVINNIVTLTAAEYTGLVTKNANTFYVVI